MTKFYRFIKKGAVYLAALFLATAPVITPAFADDGVIEITEESCVSEEIVQYSGTSDAEEKEELRFELSFDKDNLLNYICWDEDGVYFDFDEDYIDITVFNNGDVDFCTFGDLEEYGYTYTFAILDSDGKDAMANGKITYDNKDFMYVINEEGSYTVYFSLFGPDDSTEAVASVNASMNIVFSDIVEDDDDEEDEEEEGDDDDDDEEEEDDSEVNIGTESEDGEEAEGKSEDADDLNGEVEEDDDDDDNGYDDETNIGTESEEEDDDDNEDDPEVNIGTESEEEDDDDNEDDPEVNIGTESEDREEDDGLEEDDDYIEDYAEDDDYIEDYAEDDDYIEDYDEDNDRNEGDDGILVGEEEPVQTGDTRNAVILLVASVALMVFAFWIIVTKPRWPWNNKKDAAKTKSEGEEERMG